VAVRIWPLTRRSVGLCEDVVSFEAFRTDYKVYAKQKMQEAHAISSGRSATDNTYRARPTVTMGSYNLHHLQRETYIHVQCEAYTHDVRHTTYTIYSARPTPFTVEDQHHRQCETYTHAQCETYTIYSARPILTHSARPTPFTVRDLYSRTVRDLQRVRWENYILQHLQWEN
jgi:hypothetical protein